jgi:GNAT superfamily N-acetyltransferase
VTDDLAIKRLEPQDWEALRDVRLRALADTPTAFASSLGQEQRLSPVEWQRWAAGSDRMTGEPRRMMTVLAWVEASPMGMATGFFEDGASDVHLVAMWVDPVRRRQGTGRALVDAIVQWATEEEAPRVRLWITETNEAAAALYKRAGFRATGERQPLPSHPHLWEYEMDRAV